MLYLAVIGSRHAQLPQIPLPEHPRPDFQRVEWLNLNGRWRFAFDSADAGVGLGWTGGAPTGPGAKFRPVSSGAPASRPTPRASTRRRGRASPAPPPRGRPPPLAPPP